MTLPVLQAEALSPEQVDGALRSCGGFLLDTGETQLPWRAALSAAHALFALPRETKQDLAIERSPHFRGWSEMHNERDWRQQMHFGRERPVAGESPPFLLLEGPNLWPADAGWRRTVTDYMHAAAELGETVLRLIASALGLPGRPFDGLARDGYLVMKMIGYHPQDSATARPGVAAHVDFSWLTLTVQDSRGLSVLPPGGNWTVVEPRPGTVWVHAGELLQFATRGRYRALPHRVINQSIDRTRVSIPLFVNPRLTEHVPLFETPGPAGDAPLAEQEHIHRVLTASADAAPFHFGEAEWRRKGLGGWCATCAPAPAR
jgi:isopenicillin N synthase-like dioxygenase